MAVKIGDCVRLVSGHALGTEAAEHLALVSHVIDASDGAQIVNLTYISPHPIDTTTTAGATHRMVERIALVPLVSAREYGEQVYPGASLVRPYCLPLS